MDTSSKWQVPHPAPSYIELRGGTTVTLEQAKEALDEAMQIIEKVGTTGIEHSHEQATKWMMRYYPQWA